MKIQTTEVQITNFLLYHYCKLSTIKKPVVPIAIATRLLPLLFEALESVVSYVVWTRVVGTKR